MVQDRWEQRSISAMQEWGGQENPKQGAVSLQNSSEKAAWLMLRGCCSPWLTLRGCCGPWLMLRSLVNVAGMLWSLVNSAGMLRSLPHLPSLAKVVGAAQDHTQHQFQEKAAQTQDQRGLRDSRACRELHPPPLWLAWSHQPHQTPRADPCCSCHCHKCRGQSSFVSARDFEAVVTG